MDNSNVVLDTNVLIAALRSKHGASYKLLISISDNIYVPNISVPLFVEYESVAKRKGMLEGLANEDIDAILDYLLSKSRIRKVFYLWRPFLRDPKDDLVLEVAVESQCEYIVTFNKKDFKGIGKFGIEVLTPREFLLKKGILK
ncbi:MAG: putative toxin-antitoxin system toxin component, PIN family [Gammaproteobacteria bacterium]|jgi:putative PIN family toxin of toxin-antitoxin system|nr:putative toxin-antitoxin system toxin component, PIN family [Gammaproteobacteria bacterium]MBT4606999.1 putative toxin-antitoxin system toxin component, PIN family [Thiotrichales bacterium]MBT3966685.1 putative toxin-antitoxin system toxin component, PIN family [Gammaproteobacteria bacterium]MBT4081069.1 putative toxin-antitoxin system toxin component, PIN family [Gammaproteobacteria bacterium]MBT4328957.1 putative toxin-antitoxin system toxin component, PIN family [Gammaproteobacteria bacte